VGWVGRLGPFQDFPRRVEGWSGRGCWNAVPRPRRRLRRPHSNVCCPTAPLVTVNNKVYWWWNTGKGDRQSYQKQSVRIEHERRLSGCGQPCKVSSERDDVCREFGKVLKAFSSEADARRLPPQPSLSCGDQSSHR
jgi:hypothetical protein